MKKFENLTKSELRNHFFKIRKNISDENKKKQETEICNNARKYIMQNIENININKQYIALFAAVENEPNLLPLLADEKINNNFHQFCFPRITNFREGEMEFFHVKNISDLEKNTWGILEPKNCCTKISSEEIALFFIPAVSIDNNGSRIGMGGGFYDRYLSRKNNAKKIGVIFKEQKFDFDFEAEPWDIGVDVML